MCEGLDEGFQIKHKTFRCKEIVAFINYDGLKYNCCLQKIEMCFTNTHKCFQL